MKTKRNKSHRAIDRKRLAKGLQRTRWPGAMTNSQHIYEVRPRKDHRGVDLISDVLPFGRLWYGEPDPISNAIGFAKFYSRSNDAVIRVYDEAGNVIETHEHKGDFKEPEFFLASLCLSFLSFLYPPSSYNKKQRPCVRRDAICFG